MTLISGFALTGVRSLVKFRSALSDCSVFQWYMTITLRGDNSSQAEKMSTDRFVYTGTFKGHTVGIRWASHADYDDVMSIDDEVYTGLDYLPMTYHETLSDPASCNFVAEMNGQMVYYICYWLRGVNQDMTLGTAGRIHTKHRHLGLSTFIVNQLGKLMKNFYPKLRFNWGVSIYNDTMVKRSEDRNGRIIDVWNNLTSFMSPENFRKIATTKVNPVKVDNPSLSTILALVNNKEVVKFLYPKGYIFLADRWMAARTEDLSNVIRKGDVYTSGSLRTGDLGVSNAFANRCAVGMVVVVAYAGCARLDILMSHVLKAAAQYTRTSGLLDHTVQPAPGKHSREPDYKPQVALCIQCSLDIDRESIRDALVNTFQCEVRFDFYPKVGLFETSY